MPNQSKGTRQDPLSLAKYAGMILLLGTIFYPTFVWMVDRWNARDSYFAHGFLIPLVTLFWLFRMRKDLAAAPAESTGWVGPVFFLGGAFMQVVASVLRIYSLSGFAFILILIGAVALLFGRKILEKVWFPISFLSLMVPLPLLTISQITLKMKFFVSEISTWVINGIGIPAVREGSYLFTSNSVLLVGDPCSGLRSFLAFLCLGFVFAYESSMARWKRALLVMLGLPLAIISNVFRVTFLGLVGEIYGTEYTAGFLHDASGIAVFVIAFIGFMFIRSRLERQHVS